MREKTLYVNGLPLYKIRSMEDFHIPEILAIERSSFSVPWTRGIFEAEVKNLSGVSLPFALTTPDGHVAGYLCLWQVVGEMHVNNVATTPPYRGKGLGKAMMAFAEELARKRACALLTLEVRVSNEAAVTLYQKLGYTIAGTRKHYYEDTDEDALVMIKSLSSS